MKTEPFKSDRKIVEIDGLPKEKIVVSLKKEDDSLEPICDFFAKGKLTMIWERSSK